MGIDQTTHCTRRWQFLKMYNIKDMNCVHYWLKYQFYVRPKSNSDIETRSSETPPTQRHRVHCSDLCQITGHLRMASGWHVIKTKVVGLKTLKTLF